MKSRKKMIKQDIPDMNRITLYLPASLSSWVKSAAKDADCSVSKFIVRSIKAIAPDGVK